MLLFHHLSQQAPWLVAGVMVFVEYLAQAGPGLVMNLAHSLSTH